MKLIKEINESVQTITESNEAGQKEYFIEGIFLQSEIKNRNGRMYPEKTMDMAVEKYIKNT
jgi:hypothetical protein